MPLPSHPVPPQLAAVWKQAEQFRAHGDLGAAIGALEPAAEVASMAYGADDPGTLQTLLRLAVLHRLLGDLPAARRVLEEAQAGGERRFGDADEVMLAIAAELGGIAEELGNRHEARRNWTKVAQYGPDLLGESDSRVRAAQTYLATAAGGPVYVPPPRDLPRPPVAPPPVTFPLAAPEATQRLVPLTPPPVTHPDPWHTAPTQADNPANFATPQATPPVAPLHPTPPSVEAPPGTTRQGNGVSSGPPNEFGGTGVAPGVWVTAPDRTGTSGSETVGPETVGPGTVGPGTIGPGTIGPGTIGSGTIGPGTIGPGTIGPGTVAPGVGRPHAPGPDPHRVRYGEHTSDHPTAGYPTVRAVAARPGRRRRTPLVVLACVAVLVVIAAGTTAVIEFRRAGGAQAIASVTATHGGTTSAAPAAKPSSTGPGASAAPRDVTLHDTGPAVRITWTDPTPGMVPFLVSGGRSGAQAITYATLPAGQTSYTVQALSPIFDYCFAIVAVYSTSDLAISDLVCTNRHTTPSPTTN